MKTFRQFHEQQLEEGPMVDAAKEALKANAKYLPIAIPAPGGMPALAAKTAYDFYKNYKKKRKKVLAEEDTAYKEREHPRAPKGTPGGGRWVRKSTAKGLPKGVKKLLQKRAKKWWKVTQDTGDEWNQIKSRQLALQYEKAKPKLEKLINDIVSGKLGRVIIKQSEWDDLTESLKKKIEEEWKEDNFDYFYDQEKDNWYQEFGIRDAKYHIYHNNYVELGEWLKEICEQAVKEYEEEYEGEKIPYNPAQIYSAIQLALEETEYYYDAELKVNFGKPFLENPSDVNFDPKNQLDFPGIEPIDLSTHLTVKMRMYLRKKIVDAFNKKAEDALSYGNVEPPDYLIDTVHEIMDDYWATMPNDGPGSKYAFALEKEIISKEPEYDKNTLDKLPGKYLPFGVTEYDSTYNKADYERTQALAHNLFRERAIEILKERGIIQEHPGETDNISVDDPNKNTYDMWTNDVEIRKKIHDIDHSLWNGWKASSTSWEGLAIQVATSEELGGRFNKYKDIFTGKHGTYTSIDHFKKEIDSSWGYIGGYEGLKALMRAKWETTQFILDKAGKDEVSVYRSVAINQAKEGVELENVDINGRIYFRIKNAEILRNGCASTTTTRAVANGWNHYNQVVLRIIAPRTAVLSVPCYGINVHHEKEVVLAGTAWKGWDAWEGPAPAFSEVPLGNIGGKDSDLITQLMKDLGVSPNKVSGQHSKEAWVKGTSKYLFSLKKFNVNPIFLQAATLAVKLGSEDDNLENVETKVKEFLKDYYEKTNAPEVAASIAQYNTATALSYASVIADILHNIKKATKDEEKAAT